MSRGEDRAARLISRVEDFSRAHVWVAGDIMLDEYVVGSVERISPEAPVQVVSVAETFARLGGAANVARSIGTLGARVSLCGLVGQDAAAEEVARLCRENGIEGGAVGRIEGRPTTRKTRILGLGQQLLRLDLEQTQPCPEGVCGPLIEGLAEGPAPTALILADYAKGFLTPASVARLLEAARQQSVPVLVDPIGRDFSIYRGADLVKPNLKELELATGRRLRDAPLDELVAVVRSLSRAHDFGAMVLTLGERGMLAVPVEGEVEQVASRRREVYDVTGAGDTAIAVLALALSVGSNLGEAAQLANAAAGVVVGEVGAAAVEKAQLIAELEPRRSLKVVGRAALAAQVGAWRRQGRSVVFTNGCFDLLHAGHLSLLRAAAEQGDVLVVGVNSDDSVRRLKGEDRPLVNERSRVAMLAALEFVDAVTVFGEDTPFELIREIEPDVLVKGGDYRREDVVGRDVVEGRGGRVELVELMPEQSTTSLIERIRKG